MIEEHLALLKENGVVAFGKVQSKLRDYEHPNQDVLNEIYETTAMDNPIQLFLTDYNNMYVARVFSIKKELKLVKVPKYYKDLDVEYWFVFDDLRLIAHNDFEYIRDNVLANFLTTNFNNHTYTIYGNPYVYPMQVTMKEELDFFDKDEPSFKFYTNIFKSTEQLSMKQNLIDFNFGKKGFYLLAPNSQDNIISAEIEYMQNKENVLYDFSSVVVKYSKAVELELYNFMKTTFLLLIENNKNLGNFKYTVQGRNFLLKNIEVNRPNMGTYAFLLRDSEIKKTVEKHITSSQIKEFLLNDVSKFIKIMQSVRNDSVHGDSTTLQDCNTIRTEVIGIGKGSRLSDFVTHRESLAYLRFRNF